MVALLVQNMERLDEQVKEEADGIYNTLGKEMNTDTLTVTLRHSLSNSKLLDSDSVKVLWAVCNIFSARGP